jgi:flavin-dependent dehydrogenase
MAVRAYVSEVSGPVGRANLYFSSDSFPGYYWLFPTGDGLANVALGMLLERRHHHPTPTCEPLSPACSTPTRA